MIAADGQHIMQLSVIRIGTTLGTVWLPVFRYLLYMRSNRIYFHSHMITN